VAKVTAVAQREQHQDGFTWSGVKTVERKARTEVITSYHYLAGLRCQPTARVASQQSPFTPRVSAQE
jgi:hypothetical protein